MMPFRVAILYGSQTGNAQSIAEGVHEGCKQRGIDSTLSTCDGWKKLKPELKEWRAVVLVVSTTGNGDPPENAERFWRFLKRRTQPADLLAGLPFALLGLGDTNYDKFCHMGKSFDKRLRELGAKQIYPPAFADEATNMEGTVEPWLANLYPALAALKRGVEEPNAAENETGSGNGHLDATTSSDPSGSTHQSQNGRSNGSLSASNATSPRKEETVLPSSSVAGSAKEAQIRPQVETPKQESSTAPHRRAEIDSSASDVAGGARDAVATVTGDREVVQVESTIGVSPSVPVTGVDDVKQDVAVRGTGVFKVVGEMGAEREVKVEEPPNPPVSEPTIAISGAAEAFLSSGGRAEARGVEGGVDGTAKADTASLPEHRVAVMYGSQTGNAQSIAERIHEGCKAKGLESTLMTCNAWKKMSPELKEWSAAVFVMSTTGNGDPPENADRFWRFMKRRTQPKDLLLGLPVAVLGLGDTNYDKFCYMGKSLDKRLRELGAVAFYPPAFADEATTMAETVEPWVTGIYSALLALISPAAGSGASQDQGADESSAPDESLVEAAVTSASSTVNSTPLAGASAIAAASGSTTEATASAGEGVAETMTVRADDTKQKMAVEEPKVAVEESLPGEQSTPSTTTIVAVPSAPSTTTTVSPGEEPENPPQASSSSRTSVEARADVSPTDAAPTMDGEQEPGTENSLVAVETARVDPGTTSKERVVEESPISSGEASTLSGEASTPSGEASTLTAAEDTQVPGSGVDGESPAEPAAADTSGATQLSQTPEEDNPEEVEPETAAGTPPSEYGVGGGAPASSHEGGDVVNGAVVSDLVAEVAGGVFWSPMADSGVLPLSSFLEPEHMVSGFALGKEDLPRSRPPAPEVRFHELESRGDGEEGTGAHGASGAEWFRLARQHRSSSMESGHTSDWPFMARVQGARYLTKGGRGADRRVILMELSLKGSGISYEPGDVIGIRCPNDAPATEYMLRRLQAVLPPGAGPDEPFQHSIRGLPSPCTLRDALSTGLDLRAPLRRPLLRALAEWCEDDRERAWMELLCSKTVAGAAVYSRYVSAQSLTICELLEAFPSCKPASLGAFLALLPPLPPRYYSVTSSQLATPSSLAVAFSVVCHRLPVSAEHAVAGEAPASGAPDSEGFGKEVDGLSRRGAESTAANGNAADGKSCSWVVRRGLCTSWLEGMLEPLLERSSGGAVPPEGRNIHVPVFMKPAKEFLLPASAKWPCVLIGPGTGVSPFIGFLKHREEQAARRRQTADAVCSGFWRGGYEISLEGEEDEAQAYSGRDGRGDMWLFFGCRHRDHDWIFEEEMKGFLQKGTLSRLYTAFSRDSAKKVYVQDRIVECGAELSHLMTKAGAYVYVCGDGNAMAQAVHRTLAKVLVDHGGASSEHDAEAVLKAMKARNRYVLDVWS